MKSVIITLSVGTFIRHALVFSDVTQISQTFLLTKLAPIYHYFDWPLDPLEQLFFLKPSIFYEVHRKINYPKSKRIAQNSASELIEIKKPKITNKYDLVPDNTLPIKSC